MFDFSPNILLGGFGGVHIFILLINPHLIQILCGFRGVMVQHTLIVTHGRTSVKWLFYMLYIQFEPAATG